jgi:septum formation protein
MAMKDATSRVVLASASPRRRELLGALGVEFDAITPDIDERREGGSPEELVLLNARAKAEAVASAAGPEATIIAADTEVFLDGRSLGKPESEDEARSHLELLSGQTHDVWSGLFIAGPGPGQERQGVERSEVTFVEIDPPLLDTYLASGEWRDRAGGYAIQGLGSAFVTALAGDLSNVIGLPVGLLLRLAPGLAENPNSQV